VLFMYCELWSVVYVLWLCSAVYVLWFMYSKLCSVVYVLWLCSAVYVQ
jgi:hypothetical protein